MSKSLLITRPEHDDTTFYLSKWSEEVIKLANKKGILIFDLSKERANRKNVVSILSKKNPRFVVFNGHGSTISIDGSNEVLIHQKSDCANLLLKLVGKQSDFCVLKN